MGWRDNLLPAKLNNVEFYYESITSIGGRRAHNFQFPMRDTNFVDDYGRISHSYQIAGFLVGDNYMATRNSLVSLLESGKDLTFQHAYNGVFTVKIIGEYRITESVKEGGYCKIDFTLTESGPEFPLLPAYTFPRVPYFAADVKKNLSKKTKLSVLKAIGSVLKSIANGVNSAASAVRKVNGKVAAGLNRVDNIKNAVAAFQREIGMLVNTPQALINSLVALHTQVFSLIREFSPEAALVSGELPGPDLVAITQTALNSLFSFESLPESLPTATLQSLLERQAHEALTLTTKAAALAEATDLLLLLDISDSQTAASVKQNLAEKFDYLLASNLDDEILESLSSMKSAALTYFSVEGAKLPSLRTVEVNYATPAIVLAAQLGDPLLEGEILARNRVRHPLFVKAASSIKVLP